VHALRGLRQVRAIAGRAFAGGDVGRQAVGVADAGHARIEHRPEQRLRGDRHLAAIARDERETVRELAARIVPRDADLLRIAAERAGARRGPDGRAIRILRRGRKRKGRRERIIDRHYESR
jgi:uncharacterized Ntn-hydrolase superfamily protein